MSKIEDNLHALEMNNVDVSYLRDQFAKMQTALGDARLLCANLRHGGQGHMTLVENFQDTDALVDD
jgi:hypothetical protein